VSPKGVHGEKAFPHTTFFLSLSLFEAFSKPRNKGNKSKKEASLPRFSGAKSFQFKLVSKPNFISLIACDIFPWF
jgi:hypothetical protein